MEDPTVASARSFCKMNGCREGGDPPRSTADANDPYCPFISEESDNSVYWERIIG